MSTETAIHKADLLLALDAEGKPVELHHALRVVRELRQALANYEADAIHTCGPDCKRPLCVLRAELAALRAVGAAVCAWHEDDDGVYDTDCGNRWEFIEGGVADNDMKFCPYCGKPVDEHWYNDLPEGE